MLKRLNEWLAGVLTKPSIAYLSILVLQLKVIWGMWLYRDMETGDTLSYLTAAKMWHEHGIPWFAGSPLYIALYGSMFSLADDVFFATVATRIITVVLLALLVLAVMRSLLTPGIAWLITAWWVALPSNFDVMYTVHLFVAIPILLAFLAAAYLPGELGRGACLSLFLAATLLVRFEFCLGCVTFGTSCLVYEIWLRRRDGNRPAIWKRVCGYAIPLLLLAGLCGAIYLRAQDRSHVLMLLGERFKQATCQSYAFGYMQRHPEWNKNPWTECPELMQKTTGKPDPTLVQAAMKNPSAMLEHFIWNFSLIPNGLEMLLFNAAWGSVTPDYRFITTDKVRVVLCGMLLSSIWLVGLAKRKSIRTHWWTHSVEPRVWMWTAMFSLLPVAIFMMVTQRPRPESVYELSVLIMAVTGLLLQVIAGPALLARFAAMGPLVAVALLILVPVYYNDRQHRQSRIVVTAYYRLRPFTARLGPSARVMIPLGGDEVCATIAPALTAPCQAVGYYSARQQTPGAPLKEILDLRKVNLAYFDEPSLHEPEVAGFAASPELFGWRPIGVQIVAGDRWMFFERLGVHDHDERSSR